MSRKFTRRQFLKSSAVSLAAATFPGLTFPGTSIAAPGDPQALIVVQLTGGLDPLLAFPYTGDISKIRSENARVSPSLIKTTIQTGLGVHPGFSQLAPYFGSMKVIMQTGNAFILGPDRSHDIAQVYMTNGGIGGHNRRVGWTAKLFDHGINLVGFYGLPPSFNCETCNLPPIVTSNYEALNIGSTPLAIAGHPAQLGAKNSVQIEKVLETLSGYTPKSPSDTPGSDPQRLKPSREISEIEDYYRKSQRGMFHALDKITGRNGTVGTLSPQYRTPNHDFYPNAPLKNPNNPNDLYADYPNETIFNSMLGTQFRNIAQTLNEMRIKQDGSKIVFVLQLDGFDLHDNWNKNGNNLMWSLGTSLRRFLDDISAVGLFNNTALFFCTEFGRTIASNKGGAGTEHGIGYTSFVIGGRVRGGVHGNVYSTDELLKIYQSQGEGAAWPRETAQERIIEELLRTHMQIDPGLAFPGDYLSKIPAASLNLWKA